MSSLLNREREWPVGSGNWYPTSDAEEPLTLNLIDQDRCSGITNSATKCPIVMTLKKKLGALEAEMGKERLWVLWHNEHGPYRGQVAWQRWDVTKAGMKAIKLFDTRKMNGIPTKVYFKVVKPSEKLGPDGKTRKQRMRALWPSSQPGYVTKKKQPRKIVSADRSLRGKVHLRIRKPEGE